MAVSKSDLASVRDHLTAHDVTVIGFIVAMLMVGLLVGAIARFVVPGPDPMGCLGTAFLGLAGSLLGGFLADLFFGTPGQRLTLHPAGLLGSVVGAIILLLLLRALRGPGR